MQEDDEIALVHLVERLVAQQRNLRGSEQQFDQAEEPEVTGKCLIYGRSWRTAWIKSQSHVVWARACAAYIMFW